MSDFEKTSSLSGVETWVSSEDDKTTIVRKQDVEPILDHNKRLYTECTKGYSPSKDLKRIASIPNVVVEQWMKEGINVFDPGAAEEIRKRLNDPNWRHLRTSPGKA